MSKCNPLSVTFKVIGAHEHEVKSGKAAAAHDESYARQGGGK